MVLITDGQMAYYRRVAASSLLDTCMLQEEKRISDGSGGSYVDSNDKWLTRLSVACEVSPAGNTPAERNAAAAIQEVNTWSITLPAETDVRTTDSILASDGRRFAVVRALDRSREITRRVICRKVV